MHIALDRALAAIRTAGIHRHMRSKLALGAGAVRIDRHDMRIRDLALVGHVNFFTNRNVAGSKHIHRELRAGKRHFKRAVGVDKRQGVLPLTAGNGNGVCCVRDRSGARLFKMEGRTVATNKVLVENISNITPEFRDINRHMVFLLQWNVYIIKPSAPS